MRCEVVSEIGTWHLDADGREEFCRKDCANSARRRYRVEDPVRGLLSNAFYRDYDGASPERLRVCGTHVAYFRRYGYILTEVE